MEGVQNCAVRHWQREGAEPQLLIWSCYQPASWLPRRIDASRLSCKQGIAMGASPHCQALQHHLSHASPWSYQPCSEHCRQDCELPGNTKGSETPWSLSVAVSLPFRVINRP